MWQSNEQERPRDWLEPSNNGLSEVAKRTRLNLNSQLFFYKFLTAFISLNLFLLGFNLIFILTETFSSYGPGNIKSYEHALTLVSFIPFIVTFLWGSGFALRFWQITFEGKLLKQFQDLTPATETMYREAANLVKLELKLCRKIAIGIAANAVLWSFLTIEHTYFEKFSLWNRLPLIGFAIGCVIVVVYQIRSYRYKALSEINS